MDLSKLKMKTGEVAKRYKFVLLVLLVGIVMILMPTGSSKENPPESTTYITDEAHISQEDLASILCRIEGAGRVKVLLSLENSAQTDYQRDIDNASTGNGRETTVTVTDADRNETGLVRKTTAPVYRGAIIVCDGADDPVVHLSLVNAVSNITGLRTNQISVLKME